MCYFIYPVDLNRFGGERNQWWSGGLPESDSIIRPIWEFSVCDIAGIVASSFHLSKTLFYSTIGVIFMMQSQ